MDGRDVQSGQHVRAPGTSQILVRHARMLVTRAAPCKTRGMSKLFRWGILGAAEIARKNWKAILNSQNGVVTVVASRTVERSQAFIAACQAAAPFPTCPRAVGSYEELIAAKDVDGIYMPVPTGIRKEWVVRAAQAGKHIVCEKPCAVSASDLAEMLAVCRKHKVQFMDGVMFMHSQRLARMGEVLHDGQTIGPIRRISASFTFDAPAEFFRSNIRVQSQLEPYGCLGDLGWYCLRFILWAMDWKLPEQVTGRTHREAQGKGSAARYSGKRSRNRVTDESAAS